MHVLIKTAPLPQESLANLIKGLVQNRYVTHISRLVGKYDYMLVMAAPSLKVFDMALDDIKAIVPGVITDIELSNIMDGPKTGDFSGLITSNE